MSINQLFIMLFLVFCISIYAGMLAPMLVQMERQIDREIAADNKAAGVCCGIQTDADNNGGAQMISTGTENEFVDSDSEDEDEDNGVTLMYGPQPQIVTNDLKSLDEMVSQLFLSYYFTQFSACFKSLIYCCC